MSIPIESARPEDRDAIITLLEQVHLLTNDLPTDLSDFIVSREHGILIGVAGLERYNTVALLRSVAVHPQYRGQQVGARLAGYLLDKAKSTGLQEIYLLTTTADRYFDRHGFQAVNREEVPAVIQQTGQFSGFCPSSAIVMKHIFSPLIHNSIPYKIKVCYN